MRPRARAVGRWLMVRTRTQQIFTIEWRPLYKVNLREDREPVPIRHLHIRWVDDDDGGQTAPSKALLRSKGEDEVVEVRYATC